jgi:hypothetical protein
MITVNDTDTTATSAEAPAENAATSVDRPSDAAITRAELATAKVYRRPAPIRRQYIKSEITDPPPLTRITRAGEVRLKLHLSLLWLSSGYPHETSFPASAWAELLDLDDPLGRGARRVNEAVGWLESERFIDVERKRG